MHVLQPINATTPAQSALIRAIPPTFDYAYGSERITIRPAAVTFADGRTYTRAYLNHFARYSDAGSWTGPDHIADIQPSPNALPASLRAKLRAATTEDTEHLVYRLHFPNQPPLTLLADPHFADFPVLPDGYDLSHASGLTFDAVPDPATLPRAIHPAAIRIDFIYHDDPRMHPLRSR